MNDEQKSTSNRVRFFARVAVMAVIGSVLTGSGVGAAVTAVVTAPLSARAAFFKELV